jgi:hypothetical protein
MKKCVRCGLLNDDKAEACSNCEFTVFEEKPARTSRPNPTAEPASPGVTAERHGAMVRLKCRTPGEACLVRQTLESTGVIALLPDENEMGLQYSQKGYVELEIPAAAYHAAGDLPSIAEFCVPPPPPPGIGLHGKILAMLLAAVMVPGLLVFAWVLTGYRNHGEERKAKEFKLWFFIGLAAWLLIIIVLVALSS